MTSHRATAAGRDWGMESLTALVRFIVETHHVFTLRAIVSLPPLATQVRTVHAGELPESQRVEALAYRLAGDLAPHMQKEEQILFPYIESMDAVAGRGTRRTESCFGSVKNPIRMMMAEHDTAEGILAELRETTKGYALPPGASEPLEALYAGLAALEEDLHRHIRLENDVLFPRAITLEQGGRSR